jgi:ferric-dicitrate binding protein FerR (iron transport regulator)
MFKKRKPVSLADMGEDHLHDKNAMKAIEKDMLKNIHRHIRGNGRIFHLKRIKYSAAATVLVACSAALLFWIKSQSNEKLISITARKGHLATIKLPDGSTIWLNSGSTITYPEKFAAKREVQLVNGEAFFDVKHDKAHPFIVRYGNLHTQVLGTSFNIKYYKKLNDVRITVVRGLVEVGNQSKSFGMITPDKEIIYSQKDKSYNTRVINSKKVAAWKSKEINLYDVPFEDLILTLENLYSVKVNYNHEKMKDVVTTIYFKSSDDIKTVLEIITTIHDLNYTVAGREVTLASK